MHDRAPATCVSMRQALSGMFDYAMRRLPHLGIAFNPVRQVLPDLLQRKQMDVRKPTRFCATVEQARAALAAIEARHRSWSPWMLLGHRFIALTAVRKTEAFNATWDEFDLAEGLWVIPPARMKMRLAHEVVLAPQAVEVLHAAHAIRRSKYVFPAPLKNAPMHRSDLNATMARAFTYYVADVVPISPHGWRRTFSTIMNERDFRDRVLIDRMLAHRAFEKVEQAYNKAQYLAERRRIASLWADLLLAGAPSAAALIGLEPERSNIVALRRAVA